MHSKEAEEHLRVIRSLMEKATIYRAISAPTALFGALASLVCAAFIEWQSLPTVRPPGDELIASRELHFVIGWLAVLSVTGFANAVFLWRDAKRRGDQFLSSGMKHALLAMFPPMLCGAGLTACLLVPAQTYWLPPLWMLCYGLALLATRAFAPRSIQILGWTFLVAGFITLWLLAWHAAFGSGMHIRTSNLEMAATFGIFHLIYAACTWPRGAAKTNV